METVYLAIPLVCLLASLVAGLLGPWISRATAHRVTVAAVGLAFVLSVWVLVDVMRGGVFNGPVYIWGTSGSLEFQIGFLIDELSATMMAVVTFVSLMVHIYTIGYMVDDSGYRRFFSYISLFTFAMLMLVMANNFLQLFFGWEGVGLVSYLLIGFWYDRDAAVFANLKAFLVNRVGDFGFLLGIAAIAYLFGTLDYATVFAGAQGYQEATVSPFGSIEWHWLTVICLLLFVGAMGKSAQVPLHVWLPDSMEGPTPISALIHAATMVTAGIFMVARMSPLFEHTDTALSVIMVIGAITALFTGLIGVVHNDIKRVIAYSTLSQLGYMTTALGASAYAASIFHLGTHAFFKALLFLAAGSVIIAMHHQQDMRKMGGLRRYMPVTYATALVGALALAGLPPFSGFFSKDSLIEAVHASQLPGSGFAYFSLTISVFVTALYSFRLIFMVFHQQPRMDEHTRAHLRESPWVVTLPLILLAIPSVVAGALFFEPMLFGGYFGDSIQVLAGHQGGDHDSSRHGVGLLVATLGHGLTSWPLWLALAGLGTAWWCYIMRPELPGKIAQRMSALHILLINKYWVDEMYQTVFVDGARRVGNWLWRFVDDGLIDNLVVNGTARTVSWFSGIVRGLQTGLVYHYAFAMIIGLVVLLTWVLLR